MIHIWKIPCKHVGRGWGPIKLGFPIHEFKELEDLAINKENESDYTDLVCPDDTLNFIPALLADLVCFEKIDEFRHRSETPDSFLYEMDRSRDALEELNGSVVEYAHFAHRSLAVFEDELTSAVNEHPAQENPGDLPWAEPLAELVSYTEKLYSAKPDGREQILAERPEESLKKLGSDELIRAFDYLIRLYEHNYRNGIADHEDAYERIYIELIRNDAYRTYYSSLISVLENSEQYLGRLLTKRQKIILLAYALGKDVTPNALVEKAFSYASEKYREELWRIATINSLSEALSDIRDALSEADEGVRSYFSNRFPRTPGGNPKKGCAALIVPHAMQQKLIIAFNGVADDDQGLTVNGVTICEYFNKGKARASTLHNLNTLLRSNAFNRKYDVARIHTDNLCVIEKPCPVSCVSLGEVMRAVKSVPDSSSEQLTRMFSCAERKAIAFANRGRQQCDAFEGFLYATREVCHICDWTIDYYNRQSASARGGKAPTGFNLKVDRKQPAYPTSPDSVKLQAFHDLSIKVGARHSGLTFKLP